MTQCEQHFLIIIGFSWITSKIFFLLAFFGTNNFRINFQQQQLPRSPSINCLILILITRSTNLREFSTNILTSQGFEQITWHILCHNVSKYQRSHSPPNSVFEFFIAIDCNKFSQLWVIPFDPSESQHASLIELDFSNDFSPMTGTNVSEFKNRLPPSKIITEQALIQNYSTRFLTFHPVLISIQSIFSFWFLVDSWLFHTNNEDWISK